MDSQIFISAIKQPVAARPQGCGDHGSMKDLFFKLIFFISFQVLISCEYLNIQEVLQKLVVFIAVLSPEGGRPRAV